MLADSAIQRDEVEVLPRGRHAIPPEDVLAHQRARLLSAAAAALAEQGYAGTSVNDIIGRARVSRRTFYELFEDKLDCALATHLGALEVLEEVLRRACARQSSWAEGVAAAVVAGLEFAVEQPEQARLLALAPAAAEPQLTAQAIAANARLLAMLRSGREDPKEADGPGEMVEQASLMGITHLVGVELIEDRAERLPELAPELTEMLLLPYVGQAQARGVAGRTAVRSMPKA